MAIDSLFEFLKANYCNTTTQFVVNSSTGTVDNIINPDQRIQYFSDGLNNDLTIASMTISFDETLTVSRIAFKEMNLKKFRVFYNGSTANTFAFTSTSSTVTSYFTNNSETSMYLRCAPIDCTSVTIDMYSTQTPDAEKAIGLLVLTDTELNFQRTPSAANYTPKVAPEQVVHVMSDGGVRLHTVKDKQTAEIKFKNISRSFRDDLKDVYENREPFMFCPLGTSTSWDEVLFECVWPGMFDLHKFSDDAAVSGFSGTISLKETSS